jgi:hypothetical protein
MIKNLSGLLERLVWGVFKQKQVLDNAFHVYQAEYIEKALREIRLQEAKIPGLDPADKVRLAELGLVRGADISAARLMGVEGLGVAALRKLLAWRYAEEQIIRATMPRQLPADGVDRAKIKPGAAGGKRAIRKGAQPATLENGMAASPPPFPGDRTRSPAVWTK